MSDTSVIRIFSEALSDMSAPCYGDLPLIEVEEVDTEPFDPQATADSIARDACLIGGACGLIVLLLAVMVDLLVFPIFV